MSRAKEVDSAVRVEETEISRSSDSFGEQFIVFVQCATLKLFVI